MNLFNPSLSYGIIASGFKTAAVRPLKKTARPLSSTSTFGHTASYSHSYLFQKYVWPEFHPTMMKIFSPALSVVKLLKLLY